MASDPSKRKPNQEQRSDSMPCGHKKNGRNLVVCIDGTSNQFGAKNTNVIELYNLILKEDDAKQRTWYNSGIGTYARPSWKSLKYYKKVLYHKIDLAIAWGFERTVLAAYRWLSDNYEKEDCIFLFGFSRGAYQVRVLSAMIDKVGLIYKGNEVQIPFAYELYADPKSGEASVTQVGQIESQGGVPMAQRFKNAFSHKAVKVHFVGAWDTVSSIGIMRGKKMLPGTVDGMTHVCYFRHALALDERRVKYLPEYASGGTSISREKDNDTNMHEEGVVDVKHPQAMDIDGHNRSQVAKKLTEKRPQTMEVWFAGTHSDIGGGNTENVGMDRRKPPLRWMVLEATATGLRTARLDRGFLSEEKIEIRESLTSYWWILEVLPFKRLTFTRREDGVHQITYKPHLGSSRKIHPGQKIHSSLLLTNEMSTSYTPMARPLDDHPLFWEILREEGFHSKWLEVDLYEAIQALIEAFIAEGLDGSASDYLNKIATSGDGQQAIYEKMMDVLSTKDAKVQYQLLDFSIKTLRANSQCNAQLKLRPSVEVRSSLSSLLTGSEEEYQKKAREFLESFSDRNRWEVDLYNATEIEIDLFIAGNSNPASTILGKIAASGDGQQAIYEKVIKVLDTLINVECQQKLLRLSIRLFEENSQHNARLKLRPLVEVRFSVSKLSESTKEEHQKTAREFLVYFTDWSKWLGDDLDEVIQIVIGNLIAGNHDSSLSILSKIATSDAVGQAIYDEMVKCLDTPKFALQNKLLSALLIIFKNSQDNAQLKLKRSVDVRSVLSERWKRNWGYRSPAQRFLRELTDPCIDILHEETSRILTATFLFDEWVAFCLEDGTIRLRNAETKELVEELFQGHKVAVESVAISFNRVFIALRLDDGTIRLWNAKEKVVVEQSVRAPKDTVNSFAVSSDGGYIASGLLDGTIQIWNVATAELEGELRGRDMVRAVAFSPDDSCIASGLRDGTVQIWKAALVNTSGSHNRTIRDWKNTKLVRELQGYESAVECVAFSHDGRYIASGALDGRIRVWNARTAEPEGGPLEGHKTAVNSVAFRPRGLYIVSGSEDKTVRIWDLERRRLIGRPFEGHTRSIQSVSFSDDGERIVSGAQDMTARIWDAEPVVFTELRGISGFRSFFSRLFG